VLTGQGMTVWDWIREYRAEAFRSGDAQRQRLTEFHPRAYECRETDPDRALALYEEGRCLAQRLHEPSWALFFDHWRLTMLIWFKRDHGPAVLDLAVRNTLESRKSIHDPLNLRVTVQRTLLCVYQMTDVLGHAKAIREGLDALEQAITLNGEEKYLIQSNRISFAYVTEDYAAAHAACQQTLRWVDDDVTLYDAVHHSVYAYRMLCLIAWKQEDWESLETWAAVGAEVVSRSGHRMEGVEFQLWQALLARRAREEERALRLCRQAVARAGRLGVPPSGVYFEALCAFHAQAGELNKVLKLRRRELEILTRLAHRDEEVRCRIKLCRVLAAMGRSLAREAEAARAAAGRLRAPQKYLDDLAQIVHDEGPA
jgi:hypothetical protein